MKAWAAFLAVSLLCFGVMPFVRAHPNLEDYRPDYFEAGQESKGSVDLFKIILIFTFASVILKLIGFKLEYLIDVSVFSVGYFFGSLFGVGVPLALVLLSYRKSENILLYNLSSILTIVSFSSLIAPFVTPDAAMLLLALLSLYDVLGVLYLPVIQFLWLKIENSSREFTKRHKKLARGVAILTDDGAIGEGDFALPVLFALSFGNRGFFALPLLFLGFWLTHRFAKVFRTFPGLPLQAFFGSLAYFILG